MPIKEVYTFSDWTSVSQMRNVINPDLKLRCSVVVDAENNGILGYDLTVYNESSSEIVYKFKIDSGESDAWILSSEEAVMMLNIIGFPCRQNTIEIVPSELTYKTIESLKELGFIQMRRSVRPQGVLALGKDAQQVVLLEEFLNPYAYRDWLFLPHGVVVDIDNILETYKNKVTPDEN